MRRNDFYDTDYQYSDEANSYLQQESRDAGRFERSIFGRRYHNLIVSYIYEYTHNPEKADRILDSLTNFFYKQRINQEPDTCAQALMQTSYDGRNHLHDIFQITYTVAKEQDLSTIELEKLVSALLTVVTKHMEIKLTHQERLMMFTARRGHLEFTPLHLCVHTASINLFDSFITAFQRVDYLNKQTTLEDKIETLFISCGGTEHHSVYEMVMDSKDPAFINHVLKYLEQYPDIYKSFVKNSFGTISAMQKVVICGDMALIKLIAEYLFTNANSTFLSSLTSANYNGFNIVHSAVDRADLIVLNSLCNNVRDAEKNGHIEAGTYLKLLLELNHFNKSPLHFAVHKLSPTLISFLAKEITNQLAQHSLNKPYDLLNKMFSALSIPGGDAGDIISGAKKEEDITAPRRDIFYLALESMDSKTIIALFTAARQIDNNWCKEFWKNYGKDIIRRFVVCEGHPELLEFARNELAGLRFKKSQAKEIFCCQITASDKNYNIIYYFRNCTNPEKLVFFIEKIVEFSNGLEPAYQLICQMSDEVKHISKKFKNPEIEAIIHEFEEKEIDCSKIKELLSKIEKPTNAKIKLPTMSSGKAEDLSVSHKK